MRRWGLVGLVVVASMLAPALAQAANTYYASPNGSGDCSSANTACSLATAVGTKAQAGDRVVVESGTYAESATVSFSNVSGSGITIQGASPIPTISFSSGGLSVIGAGSKVSNIEVASTGTSTAIEVRGGGSEVDHVSAHAASGVACALDAAVNISDSLCVSTGGVGLTMAAAVSGGGAQTVQNVTAIGKSIGIAASDQLFTMTVTVRNSIAMASNGVDISASAGQGPQNTSSCQVSVVYSDFATSSNPAQNASVTSNGTDTTSPPVFVDAAHGNFHELGGSPTIGTGDPTVLTNGDTDLEGNPRTTNGQVDMGAYQYAAPIVTTLAATGINVGGATLNGAIATHGASGSAQFELGKTTGYGTVVPLGSVSGGTVPEARPVAGLDANTTYHYRLDFVVGGSTTIPGADQTFTTSNPVKPPVPVISGFSLNPASFIAANSGPTIAAVVGTKVSLRLNVAAVVGFAVARTQPGVIKGGKCVAPPKKKKKSHPKRCTRTTAVGGFTFAGKAGANSFRFMGRLRGQSLPKGSYTLTGIAIAAGKASKPVTARFTIVG